MRPNRAILLAAAALAAGTAPALAADTTPALAAGTTERASVSSSGAQGDGESALPSISAHGRYVAFVSAASNLVPNDTNGSNCPGRFEVCGFDVFVRDLKAGTTERVSVSSAGAQGDGDSGAGNFGTAGPAISADGRYVAFASVATDLVPGDTNGRSDVFVRDRQTGTTERVSVSSSGQQGNFDSGGLSGSGVAISADGRYVAFESFASNLVPNDTDCCGIQIYVRDRKTGTTERVSVSSSGRQGDLGGGGGDIESSAPAISRDGRYVAFASIGTDLVPGDTNGRGDVFVRDRKLGTTELVSVGPRGRQGNDSSGDDALAISADGRYVAFVSDATDLVPHDTNGTGCGKKLEDCGSDVFVRPR